MLEITFSIKLSIIPSETNEPLSIIVFILIPKELFSAVPVDKQLKILNYAKLQYLKNGVTTAQNGLAEAALFYPLAILLQN